MKPVSWAGFFFQPAQTPSGFVRVYLCIDFIRTANQSLGKLVICENPSGSIAKKEGAEPEGSSTPGAAACDRSTPLSCKHHIAIKWIAPIALKLANCCVESLNCPSPRPWIFQCPGQIICPFQQFPTNITESLGGFIFNAFNKMNGALSCCFSISNPA